MSTLLLAKQHEVAQQVGAKILSLEPVARRFLEHYLEGEIDSDDT